MIALERAIVMAAKHRMEAGIVVQSQIKETAEVLKQLEEESNRAKQSVERFIKETCERPIKGPDFSKVKFNPKKHRKESGSKYF